MKKKKEHEIFMQKISNDKLIIVSPLYKSHQRVDGLDDMSGEHDEESFHKFLLNLSDKQLLMKDGKTVDTKIRKKIYGCTIGKFAEMVGGKSFYGQGITSLNLYGIKGSGKTETYKDIACMIPYAFQNHRVIAIHYSLTSNETPKALSTIIFHALKEYLPDMRKKDYTDYNTDRISINLLMKILKKEKIYLHIMIDELDLFYQSTKDLDKRLEFFGDMLDMSTYLSQPMLFFFVSGSSRVLPRLLKRTIDPFTAEKYPLVKHAPDMNGSKFTSKYLPNDWVMTEKDYNNYSIIAKRQLTSKEKFTIRLISGNNLRFASKIIDGLLPFENIEKQFPYELIPLVTEIYQKLFNDNITYFDRFQQNHGIELRNIISLLESLQDPEKLDFDKALSYLDNVVRLTGEELRVIIMNFCEKTKSSRQPDYLFNDLLEQHLIEQYDDSTFFPNCLFYLIASHIYLQRIESGLLSDILVNIIKSPKIALEKAIFHLVQKNLKELQDICEPLILDEKYKYTRAHVYHLTKNYEEGTIGFVVNRIVSDIYSFLGNNFSAEIGELFCRENIKRLLDSKFTNQVCEELAREEHNFWSSVTDPIAKKFGALFSYEDRIYVLSLYNDKEYTKALVYIRNKLKEYIKI